MGLIKEASIRSLSTMKCHHAQFTYESTLLDNFFTVDKIQHSHFLIKSNHPITILSNPILAHSALATFEISDGKMT
jgi:hypothetical protein